MLKFITWMFTTRLGWALFSLICIFILTFLKAPQWCYGPFVLCLIYVWLYGLYAGISNHFTRKRK